VAQLPARGKRVILKNSNCGSGGHVASRSVGTRGVLSPGVKSINRYEMHLIHRVVCFLFYYKMQYEYV
jgi:hypothetical protein